MSKKSIIVFEGIEGTGKSHHIKKVTNYLKKIKKNFIHIREPGGSKNSEKIRKLLLNNKSTFNKYTDLLLYLSTIAYQHYGMGINLKFIQFINNFLLKGINIDFTFLNTVSQKNMKNRLKQRKNLNRYDKFNHKFYEKVQKGFLKILRRNPKKYMHIDSNLNIDHNEKVILSKINSLI